MIITFFARRFYPHIGGVEKHVMEVGKRLVKQGHTVIVITEAVEHTPKHEVVEGIEVYRIAVGRDDRLKKFRIWKSLFSLNTIIKKSDVIHCHDVFFWYLPFAFLYSQKKVYTTFHGYEGYPISKKAILIRKLSEKLSDGNICIGDFITKWYKTNPTYVSYGAVDLPDRKNHKTVKKDSAVFIGRVHEHTGVLTYVNVYERLKKKFPKFEFLIVGDGPHRPSIPKEISLTGFQKKPEQYLTKYHFVFASGYLSILEAFATKKLVVATYDNPLKKDYLTMTPFAAWMIIEKSPEKIVERIDELLQNPKKEEKMTSSSYNWVKKQSWEKLVDTYLTLWGNNS